VIAKDILRKKVRKKGDSQKIYEQVCQMYEYKKSSRIHIFLSQPNEPDTKAIIENAWHNGKKVFVPVVQDHILGSVEFGPNDKLIIGKFGILVPNKKNIVDQLELDIIFVPLVAFDKNKNRLGRGGGFYDRFLLNHNAYKIGLAFSSQKINRVPIEKHDVSLDIIITD